MTRKNNLITIILFLSLIGVRFIGLDYSPPGFYLDEAAGATQVICLQQQGGVDFYGKHFPLFFKEFNDAGIFTPTYIYGQTSWTTLFGYSTYSFRSFIAFISILTIVSLYYYTKKMSNEKIAYLTAFSALIMPWSFHFSRIAWDPPVAVFLLVLSLLLSVSKKFWWLTGISLALAAYSYSPTRIIAPLLLLSLPNLGWRKKIAIGLIALITCVPLLLAMQDQQFMARANNVAIWSRLYNNPYANSDPLELFAIFTRQFFSHFSPQFLFVLGDSNLRHSIHNFGMLSWFDLAIPAAIVIFFIKEKYKIKELQKKFLYIDLLIIAILGILISAIPAALTRDGIPHSLRALSSWPFYAIMSGICLNFIAIQYPKSKIIYFAILAGIFFFIFYIYYFFTVYPSVSKSYFQVQGQYHSEPIALAYERMAANSEKCFDIRNEPLYTPPPNTKINQPIDFSINGAGIQYLRNSWQKAESWGVWSNGYESDLLLPLPQRKPTILELKLRAFHENKLASQKVRVLIDGKYVGTYFLKKEGVNIVDLPLKELDTNKIDITITFKYSQPAKPTSPQNNDNRLIAIGIETATFK